MGDFLDQLGLSSEAWQKRFDKASADARAEAEAFAPRPEPEPVMAKMPFKNDPNLPLSTSVDDVTDPGLVNFMAALPPAPTNDQKFQQIKDRLANNYGTGAFFDPTQQTVIMENEPRYQEALANAALAEYKKSQDEAKDSAAEGGKEKDSKLAEWKKLAERYKSLGITPPTLPPSATPELSPQPSADINALAKTESPKEEPQDKEEKPPIRGGAKVSGSVAVRGLTADPHQAYGAAAAASPPKDYLNDMLSKLYGQGADQAALTEAIKHRNNEQMSAELMMAGQQLAGGFSGGRYKPDYAVSNLISKNAGQGLDDVLARRKMVDEGIATGVKLSDFQDKEALRDPSSPISKSYRDMAAHYGMPMPADSTAESIKNAFPFLDTVLKQQSLKLTKSMYMDQKLEKEQDNAFHQMASELDSQRAKKGSQFGRNAQIYGQGMKIYDIIGGRNLDQLTPQENADVIVAYAGMLSPTGTPTKAVFDKMLPNSGVSTAEGVVQWITNHPQSAQGGALIAPFVRAASSDMNTAQSMMQKTITMAASGHDHAIRREPERMRRFLENNGLPPTLGDEILSGKAGKKYTTADHDETKSRAEALNFVQKNANSTDPKVRSQVEQVKQTLKQQGWM